MLTAVVKFRDCGHPEFIEIPNRDWLYRLATMANVEYVQGVGLYADTLAIAGPELHECPKPEWPSNTGMDMVIAEILLGRKIVAIKEFKALTNCSLVDSKRAVEWLMAKINEAEDRIRAEFNDDLCYDYPDFRENEGEPPF